MSEIIEAAKRLQELCNRSECMHCPLFNTPKAEKRCISRSGAITDWAIPKLNRWTPEDIALANALAEFEVGGIERVSNGGIRALGFGTKCGVPRGAFESLEVGEYVTLDSIIKSAEDPK